MFLDISKQEGGVGVGPGSRRGKQQKAPNNQIN